jgi:hypothetical protein
MASLLFLTILTGKVEPPPAPGAWMERWAKTKEFAGAMKDFSKWWWKNGGEQFIVLDVGRFYNPINPFHGGYSTREYQDKLTQNLAVSPDNSILLTSYGVKTDLYPLDEKVKGLEVRLWRPNPPAWDTVPLGINTIFLSIAKPYYENPKFYAVSPCTGIAKVWKSGDTIYVSMNRDETPPSKCPAGGGGADDYLFCAQKAESLSTEANYCYADQKLLWGTGVIDAGGNIGADGDVMFKTVEFTAAGLFTWGALCSIPFTAPICAASVAATAGKFVAVGGFTAWTATTSHSNWGYWTVYKASDACDLMDLIFSVAGGRATNPKAYASIFGSSQKVAKYGTSTGGKAMKAAFKKTDTMLPDLCMLIYVAGEQELQWPNRGKKAIAPMNETCIQEVAGRCVWGAG